MNAYRSHLSDKQREKLFSCFLEDALAATAPGSPNQRGAAARVGANRKTVDKWYKMLRQVIYEHQTKLTHLKGTVEIDHHTFNARQKKRWRKDKDDKWVALPTRSVLVFGLLERDADKRHRVYVQIVRHADKKTTQPIVKHVVDAGSILYSDMWRSFNDIGQEYTHRRVNHAKGQYARKEGAESVHTATIDRFWQFCENRLSRFNGLHHSTIHLHIQECAFRYNHRHDLRKALKALLR